MSLFSGTVTNTDVFLLQPSGNNITDIEFRAGADRKQPTLKAHLLSLSLSYFALKVSLCGDDGTTDFYELSVCIH